MHAESHLPVIIFGIGSVPLRALFLTSVDRAVTVLRRSSIALVEGACFCALRQSASSGGANAPVSAGSVRKPRSGYRAKSGSGPMWITLASALGAPSFGIHGT